jgi:cytochrome c
VLVLLAVTGGSLQCAAADDLELGEYLASECVSCHRSDAVNQGIPNIFGIPRVVFVQAMEQYRDGSRINEIMRNVVRSLDDDEIAALAAYLEQAVPSN